MNTCWHGLEHYLQRQPVAHVAWVMTALIALLIAPLVLRPSFRRLTQSGNRAHKRITLLLLLLLGGMAVLIGLDLGYGTTLRETYAQQPATEYGQTLDASRPFHIAHYYTFSQSISSDPRIAGTVPEMKLHTSWIKIGPQTPFSASVLGIPGDLASSFRLGGSVAAGLRGMIERWQTAINGIKPGQAYIDQSLAQATGIRAGNDIFTRAAGGPTYLTIRGILPDREMAGTGAVVILPLSTVQQLFGAGDRISGIEIVYSATSGSDRHLTARHILARAGSIPAARLVPAQWTFASSVRVVSSGDVDRWLATGALILVLACSLCIWYLGRRLEESAHAVAEPLRPSEVAGRSRS